MVLVFRAREPRPRGDWEKVLHGPCGLVRGLWGTRHMKTHHLPKSRWGACWEGEQRHEANFLPRKWHRKVKPLVEPGSELSYLDFKFGHDGRNSNNNL